LIGDRGTWQHMPVIYMVFAQPMDSVRLADCLSGAW
jgi:hypothetical protein